MSEPVFMDTGYVIAMSYGTCPPSQQRILSVRSILYFLSKLTDDLWG